MIDFSSFRRLRTHCESISASLNRFTEVRYGEKRLSVKMTEEVNLFSREAQSNKAYEKIKKRKVCVIGCGNVGSVVATILAESGICDIDLIDMDEFSYIDNRQLYSTESNMEVNKALATAHGIAERTDCYVKPYEGDAIEMLNNGRLSLNGRDVFMCVDSVAARKDIFDAAMTNHEPEKILDVGVEDNTIQVAIYSEKRPHDMYFDSGQAHCVTIPLASFRAFMGASLMVAAYFSLFETEGTEDPPLIPPDHALQIYTNTMEKFLRKI